MKFRAAAFGAWLIAACTADVRLGDLRSEAVIADRGPASEGGIGDGSDFDGTTDAQAKEGGADVDTSTCARDCKGNPCSADVCQPVTIVSGQSGISYFVVDEADVFWGTVGHAGTSIDPNSFAKTAKAGGGSVVVLDNGSGFPRGIVVDATQVFWVRQISSTATVSRASKLDGSNLAVVGMRTGVVDVQGLAATTNDLYLVEGTTVRTFLKSDSAAPGGLLATGLTAGVSIALDGDDLFVADRGANAVQMVGRVFGATQVLGAVGSTCLDVAFDATHVYFAANAQVGRIARADGTVQTIASSGGAGIAVDASFVYFTTAYTVHKVAKGSTVAAGTVLASGLAAAGRVALDADFVYFADIGSGTIRRVPK